MGWKSIKDHYRIEHIVQVTDAGICIGSGYISDLICVTDGVPKWGNSRPAANPDLLRYFEEMSADLGLLRSLIDESDTFEKSIPVYTYADGKILEKYCEELGWPNCTHDGDLMYENIFFADRNDARTAGIRNATASVELTEDTVARLKKELNRAIQLLDKQKANLGSLMTD